MIEQINNFEINFNKNSSRIIDIDISDEILNKLIFPFNKFDITALSTNLLQGLLLQKFR